MALRGKAGELDNNFLKYSLLYSANRRRLLLTTRGSTVPRVLKTDITNLEIPIPPFPIQRRIAEILGRLDDKIEVNRRINCTLEGMAQALYKHWFVDFGPFQDGAFVESEVGLIPAGWAVKPIGELVDVFLGGDWGKSEPQDDFVEKVAIIRGTDFSQLQNGQMSSCPIRYIKGRSAKKRSLQAGDIVIENSVNATSRAAGTSLYVTQGMLDRLGEFQIVICASFGRMLRLKSQELAPLVYLKLSHEYQTGELERFQNIASNGIANFQSQRFLKEFSVVLPPANLLQEFFLIVTQLINDPHIDENYLLAATRDYLLPKLLSGEVDVSDSVAGEDEFVGQRGLAG